MPSLEQVGFVALIGRVYKKFAGLCICGQSLFLLCIRLYLGYTCARSGYWHLTGFQHTVKQFTEWKVPHPEINAAISGLTELMGGALLLVGFASRFIAIPLTINFLVAIITIQSLHNVLHFWQNMNDILGDTAFPYFMGSLTTLFFGAGWLSIDGILRLIYRKPKPQATI